MLSRLRQLKLWYEQRHLYSYRVHGPRSHQVILSRVDAERDGELVLHFFRLGLTSGELRVPVRARVTADGLELHDPATCCFSAGSDHTVGNSANVRAVHSQLLEQMRTPTFHRDLLRGHDALTAYRQGTRRTRRDSPPTLDSVLLHLASETREVRQVALAMLSTMDPTHSGLPTVLPSARAAVAD